MAGRRDVPCSVEERMAGAEVALVGLDRAWRRLGPPDEELAARRRDLHHAWDQVIEQADRWDDDGEARAWRRLSDAASVLGMAVATSSTPAATELLESASELCERVQAVLDRLELDRSFHAIVGGLRRVDGRS